MEKRILTTSYDELKKVKITMSNMENCQYVRDTKLGDDVLFIIYCDPSDLDLLLDKHNIKLYTNFLKITYDI